MSKKIRKLRVVNKTFLIVCEGVSDKRFLERIKRFTVQRDGGLRVTVDESGGGGPRGVLNRAINYPGQFDKKYMFIDSDIAITQEVAKIAQRKNIRIIQSRPFCLEGLLLKSKGFAREIRDSQHAKQEMRNIYDLDLGITERWYEEHLTQEFFLSAIEDERNPASEVFLEIRGMFIL
ncbi:Uncharacterised protein [Serratia entomophila]|uniref:RloB family protein n=1 Tax=Serratia entomophila TaxID=42906 RepID=UPI00217CADEB|nr:RloB family protein [Serratia entomophila]CAI1776425.1 Uncharacterised protein [Serratia entomophila]CAI2926355.1 Uncharacterised protein [Serratia entomophila]